ncbi:MAG: CRISPR-associated helicase Cas3', partial [Mailhella sp.]
MLGEACMIRRKIEKKEDTPVLPLEYCLAKTWQNEGKTFPGRTVEQHSLITQSVALELLGTLPCSVRRFFPEYSEKVPLVHDIGKITPMFAKKLWKNVNGLALVPQLENVDSELEKNSGWHWSVSYATMMSILPDSPHVAEIVGWHHGKRPERKSACHEAYGGHSWQDLRRKMVSLLNPEGKWPRIDTPDQTLLLKGLTTVSDWIASGEIFEDPKTDWQSLVKDAVKNAGFVRRCIRKNLSFEKIFGNRPYPLQQTFIDAVDGPGVYVLEAPMGLGKTEAALYAAYVMLEQEKASGIYFALPTCLTSNKIYDRVLKFLNMVADDSVPMLLHGKAWLLRELGTLGDAAAPGNEWFSVAKRGLLAPFAVGTIDQALLSVIAVRHNFVRAYGLAGKVVILDEVHSYDEYTGTLLDKLVKCLSSLGCTVIILSATLTRERKKAIIGAECTDNAYPLVSSCKEGKVQEFSCMAPNDVSISLSFHENDDQALEEALEKAELGQQVLWIENTVAEAQDKYCTLAARASAMNIEVGLLHSRFTPADREKKEAKWTLLYGAERGERSTCGRILVGTQVLEQSLDIDADFLVTRICPADMLFQRMGRLWRHSGTVRPPSARREALILSPNKDKAVHEPFHSFGVTGYVYSPYVLARTVERWCELNTVSLPSNIKPVIEDVYRDRPVDAEPTVAMIEAKKDLIKKREELRRLALASGDINAGMDSDQQSRTR